MKTKVLIVPTLIILAGFVLLNNIKPDFDTYMQKRALRNEAEKNALQAETLANNVKTLRAEMDSQKPKVDFLKRYFPDNKDQGRMFDSLNFLTVQSGLITSKIQVADIEEEDTSLTDQTFGTLDPAVDADPLQSIAGDPAGLTPDALLTPYQAPKVRRYNVAFEALGSYGSIKELLQKLTTADRYQEFQSFKISLGEVTAPAEGEEAAAGSGTLTLTYNTTLPYQAVPQTLSGEAIVSIPGLSQSNFDFAGIDTIQSAVTAVPDVVLGNEGKGNPFE